MPAYRRRDWPWLPEDVDEALGDSVLKYFNSQRPPTTIRTGREDIIEQIEELIRDILPDYHADSMSVECYGSTVYGVDSRSSDLDLIILDGDRRLGFPPGANAHPAQLPKLYNMEWLASRLRSNTDFTHVVAITSASVPIVKFYDPAASINVDINCNARLGLSNTRLIQKYCELYHPLRAMIYFIKKWAQYRQINDSSGQSGRRSLSSHCYTLMAVTYLQIRRVLPNLQLERDLRHVDESWFWIKQDRCRIRCDTRIGTAPSFRTSIELSLADALYGWFKYFGDEYDYGDEVLSPQQGDVLTYGYLTDPERNPQRDQIGPQAEDLKHSLLMVQDPFHLSKNVAGSCDDSVIEDLQRYCKITASCMENGHSAKTLIMTVD